MPQQLPDWVIHLQALGPVFNGFGTLIVGACVGYIAWRQWETARHKLRMELYDRRLAVYESIRESYRYLSDPEAKMTPAKHRALLHKTEEFRFLFDTRADQTISALMLHAIDLADAHDDGSALTDVEREQLTENWQKARLAFKAQMDLSKI